MGRRLGRSARSTGPISPSSTPITWLHVEHLFVEEDQGIEGLVLGGGRHVAVRGQVVQEAPDVVLVEAVGWVVSWNRTKRVSQRTYAFSVW